MPGKKAKTEEERIARRKASRLRHYYANKEDYSANNKAWRSKNLDERKSYERAYRQSNPDKMAVKVNRRRASIMNAPVNDLKASEWREVLEQYGCCVYCGASDRKLTQDHVIPLSKGGSHTKTNVVPACRSCNSKKGCDVWEVKVKSASLD